MVYVGDKNALNELIGYYDGLKQGIEELQQERNQFKEYNNHNYDKAKKYKEVIDKLKELIIELSDNTDDITCYEIDKDCKNDLLDILKEVE